MHYPHIGSPTRQATWGIYTSGDGFSGPRDAEITHWVPMFEVPEGAPTND